MGKCKEYLREAKTKGWTIDYGDLMNRFNLTVVQVRHCVNEIYFSK